MTESIPDLRKAILDLHGCESAFVESVPVVEGLRLKRSGSAPIGGQETAQIVWRGTVYVFDLLGHPTAKRAYAWSWQFPESTRRHYAAVLHAGPVDSPRAAVQASIISDYRARRGG